MEDSAGTNGKREDLVVENDFLKLKLMAELGARFGSSGNLPPELENRFLKSVIEFEDQFSKAERITVHEKIGRPEHFRPVAEIDEADIEHEWEQLYEYLRQHDVTLDVCSPNVSARELYRFATEELFQVQTDNISMPGLTSCFIYDEFHPDHYYENTTAAVDECMAYIIEKIPFFDHQFADRVNLNNTHGLSRSELQYVVNTFKKAYDQIVPLQLAAKNCTIEDDKCHVNGQYEAAFIIRTKSVLRKGDWRVSFTQDKETGYWYIDEVQISGIEFN